MKNDNPAIRTATEAYCRSLLYSMLPAIREAAKFKGYAIATHGSVARDIDLIAVAWTEQAKPPEELVIAICGAVSGVLGNCFMLSALSPKPHGRVGCILAHPGFVGEIDLSIIPPTPKKTEET